MRKIMFFQVIILAMFFVGCDQVDVEDEQNDFVRLKTTNFDGQFSVLNYNVAGLLFPYCCGDAVANTTLIGQKLNNYSIVNVQEDFNYHSTLYAYANHEYRTPTSGGMGIGSGLNSMSIFPFDDFIRVKWSNCYGVDCLTPKGLTMKRIRLQEGVYLDLYNAHTNAGASNSELAARRANVNQLVNYINANSAGNAVLFMGDLNCRYTRVEDVVRLLRTSCGMTDVWVELIKNGVEPALGDPALVCPYGDTLINYDCEVVDKIFYRGNNFIELTPTSFSYEDDEFRDANGNMLSDHYPLLANFNYTLNNNLKLSDQFGGPHGTNFNNVNNLPSNPQVTTIGLRAGSRVDQVNISLNNGTSFSHGGSGGTAKSLTLNSGEYVKSVKLCSGKYNNTTRIFYAEFTTSQGRKVNGGSTTNSTVTYTAPNGWQIVGFHGRSGANVDKLGVIYAPI